ncbi:CRISPR-associated protein Cas4 [Thermoanaerobacter kivui]|uniref:CRISPR-associated exonuclease Cas4 n=1 Tax=Thermoanaerobacter kivui TaxID=2325 RepID=A0A097AT48_THEKI|nr:CRISPR-associated protein Cas4 [Thermoanaerobacter kivui]AIS52979.1 CRISPR-associated protein Cas4 [Thermoanaerobacter kivui]
MILNVIFLFFVVYLLIQAIIEKRPPYKKMRRSIGFRGGKIIYIDKQQEVKEKGVTYGKLLKSDKYGLSGKPDYIYQLGEELVPIELKSSEADDSPYYKDVMQLVAYFLIIEDVYNKKVRRGRIVYRNTMFEVYNKKYLKKELLNLVDKMKKMKQGNYFPEIKPSFALCRFCPCRGTVCEIYNDASK